MSIPTHSWHIGRSHLTGALLFLGVTFASPALLAQPDLSKASRADASYMMDRIIGELPEYCSYFSQLRNATCQFVFGAEKPESCQFRYVIMASGRADVDPEETGGVSSLPERREETYLFDLRQARIGQNNYSRNAVLVESVSGFSDFNLSTKRVYQSTKYSSSQKTSETPSRTKSVRILVPEEFKQTATQAMRRLIALCGGGDPPLRESISHTRQGLAARPSVAAGLQPEPQA
jgi:hypothetical protein